MRAPALIVLCSFAAACSTLTARGRDPAAAWTAQASLDTTASCVVRALNTAMRSTGPLTPSITHAIQITEPGRVYEVAPQQTLTIGAEIYYARLTVAAPKSTRIELFSSAAWTARLTAEVQKCAGAI